MKRNMSGLMNFQRLKKRQKIASRRDAGAGLPTVRPQKLARSGFTLLEVMIAVGILFMCLFAVLALTSNSLATARKIQQHRDLDAGSFVGYFYVQLANTNRIDEGDANIDLGDSFPGYKTALNCSLAGTNGLWDIEYRVADPAKRAEVHGHFLLYNPNSQQTGISRNLPTHH
jgi:hypothetical protein